MGDLRSKNLSSVSASRCSLINAHRQLMMQRLVVECLSPWRRSSQPRNREEGRDELRVVKRLRRCRDESIWHL